MPKGISGYVLFFFVISECWDVADPVQRCPMIGGLLVVLMASANTSKTRSTRSSLAFCPMSPTRQMRPAVGPNPPAISTLRLQRFID